MASNKKQRKGLDGDFGRETPSTTGTTAKIHTWFAGWHLDDGFSVTETDKFVDTLRKLKWTAADIRELSVEELLHDLHACDYTFEWAPILAGDIQRATTLKDLISLRPMTPSRDLPEIKIAPNKHFIDNMPSATATTNEVRAWLKLWFNYRPTELEFKLFATKFEYQSPESLVEEVPWNGMDLFCVTMPVIKKSILGRHLRGIYQRALSADIRAARKKMRDNMGREEWKELLRVGRTERARRSV